MYLSIFFQDKGNIYGHSVKLSSNEYTPVDDTSIPTGEIKSVQDTVFDLREETILSPEQLAKVDGKVHLYRFTFDHSFTCRDKFKMLFLDWSCCA